MQNWIGKKRTPLEQARFVPPSPIVMGDVLEEWEAETIRSNVEGFLAHNMAVVVTPAPDHRVEAVDENPLRQTFACADESSHALLDRCDAGCGWLDEQLALIFSDIETEKIEALIVTGV